MWKREMEGRVCVCRQAKIVGAQMNGMLLNYRWWLLDRQFTSRNNEHLSSININLKKKEMDIAWDFMNFQDKGSKW